MLTLLRVRCAPISKTPGGWSASGILIHQQDYGFRLPRYFRLSGGGLIEGKLVIEFLHGLAIAKSIESYAKRYAAVATDLNTGREILSARALKAALGEED